jgi:hypothetical protein
MNDITRDQAHQLINREPNVFIVTAELEPKSTIGHVSIDEMEMEAKTRIYRCR